jgi:gluconate kinase
VLSVEKATYKGDGIAIGIVHNQPDMDGRLLILNRDGVDESPIQMTGSAKMAIEPNHDPKGRDVIMVGGKSGSGKSHIARNFAIRYHELYPKRKIYLISYLDEDLTLDSVGNILKRINAEKFDDEETEYDIKDFKESLVIVDDVEGYERTNKKIFNGIQSVIDMVATMGRHIASSIVVCSHLLTDYKRTRLFLGEAQQFVTFMHGASRKQIFGLLGGYAGLDDEEINELRKVNSRWICTRTQFPVVALHEKGAFLIRRKKEEIKKRKIVETD